MKCSRCGGDIIEGRCIVCGNDVSSNTAQQPRVNQNTYYSGTNPASNPYSSRMDYSPKNEPVSVARWVGRMFLTWIPFVGGLIYLIMLIIWACSDRFEKTSKNWAIASLIMAAVNIIVGVIIIWAVFALLFAVFDEPSVQHDLQNFLNTLPTY